MWYWCSLNESEAGQRFSTLGASKGHQGQAGPRSHQHFLREELKSSQLRMSMQRLLRLTNAFSRKIENRAGSVALYMMARHENRRKEDVDH
jgi:hypothetical protein